MPYLQAKHCTCKTMQRQDNLERKDNLNVLQSHLHSRKTIHKKGKTIELRQDNQNCLAGIHSARQSRLSCKHPLKLSWLDHAFSQTNNCLADFLISSVRQKNIVLAVASNLRSDNLIVLLESSPFGKTKTFVLLWLHCHLVRQLRLSFGCL